MANAQASLVIRISAQSKAFADELEKVRKQTEDLEDQLGTLAKGSGLIFAALTAEVALSTKALLDQQRATNDVNQALQNQGLYTREVAAAYRDWAEAIEEKTGIDANAISTNQAMMQGLIGQTQLTEALTQAVVDFSAAKKVDLKAATELVAKGINGQLGPLKELGLRISETATKEERLAQITEQLNQRFGGQAAAAAKGLGGIERVEAGFMKLQRALAERFAPALEAAFHWVADLFAALSKNKPLLDLVVSAGAAVAVVSGLGLVAGTAGIAVLKLRAALMAAQVATSAMSIAVKGLVGATGIGLLVILATELYLNWQTIWPRMQAIFAAFVQNVGDAAAGLGKVLFGAMNFKPALIQEGLKDFKTALSRGFEEAAKDLPPITPPPIAQDPARKAAADAAEAEAREREARRLAVLQASNELLALEARRASGQLVALKQQEVELLKQIEDDKNAGVRDALQAHLEQVRMLQDEARAAEFEQRQFFNEELLAGNEEFQALTAEQQDLFLAEQQQKLQDQILTEGQARRQVAADTLTQQLQFHNQYLMNQAKFGTAYAVIWAAMNNNIVKGAGRAFGELEQMQTSRQATLKRIGKAAAVANIVMKTAESAMNIYAGFSTIPFIGPALGIAGAAAAIAFGGEQIVKVNNAAQGGLLQGGIPGVDSIPVLAQHMELVAPAQNFEEVIGSVRAAREAASLRERGLAPGPAGDGAGGGVAEVVLSLRDNLVEFVEARIVERQNLGISLIPRAA